MSDAGTISVDELEVGPRTYHCIKRHGFRTLGDLAKLTPRELISFRGIGVKTVKEIAKALAEHGCALADSSVEGEK